MLSLKIRISDHFRCIFCAIIITGVKVKGILHFNGYKQNILQNLKYVWQKTRIL